MKFAISAICMQEFFLEISTPANSYATARNYLSAVVALVLLRHCVGKRTGTSLLSLSHLSLHVIFWNSGGTKDHRGAGNPSRGKCPLERRR